MEDRRIASHEPQPPLAAIGLACRKGDALLFKDLGFRVEAGRLAWLRGRNGRGKTSLLKLAAGLAPPAQGRIERDGRELIYIGHTTALKDDLTLSEALAFLQRLHGRRCSDAQLKAAIEQLDLRTRRDALVRSLSQGQRRRVALARLLMDDAPSLWLLDEPFDALDADGVQQLNGLLHAHLQRGGAVLVSSHAGLDADRLQPAEIDLDRYC